ncbi:response regulator transcription factor [Exilibacterium tricleocarpae]|uniref:Response regulator transcription factor n=1 Tax=Exilibacterium tricleocarpae TaxID=2591008 RepID=A0A545T0M9_9GAMM|nr:LytTR family DNA-binding domain-containing protein [Exilibacterium tricleocarpae]TQV70774.1 response regulator transcription factor [Exilibacterium tricleocarpae]
MDVLIVDDEPLARDRLIRMVEKIDHCRVVAQAGTTERALQAVREHDPDVVLLDVRMPGADGLSAAADLAELDDPPAIIFCTAYDEYALDAFDTEAVGYLLKPVKQEQLETALTRARKLNKVQLAVLSQRQTGREDESQRSHISAKTRRGVELIPLDDVRFFIADHKYVTVHHVGGETLIDDTLKDLENEFGSQFVRVHRNALVAVRHIEGMERASQGHYQIRLKDIEQRPVVSRRHVAKLRELMAQI